MSRFWQHLRLGILRTAAAAALLLAVLGCAPLTMWLPAPEAMPPVTPSDVPAHPPATPATGPTIATASPVAAPAHTPSEMPTAVSVALVVLSPTDIAAPPAATPRAPSALAAAITSDTAEMRAGPGATYAAVGTLRRGDWVTIAARNGAGTWLKVRGVGGLEGWIGAGEVSVSRTVRSVVAHAAARPDVPAAQAPATVAPAEPTPAAAATPAPAALPVRITIPRLGIDCPVVEVGWREEVVEGQLQLVWQVAAYAAGHHQGSALPGQPGNMVISGHHNTEGEVFKGITLAWPELGAEELDEITSRSGVLDGQSVLVRDQAGGVFEYTIEGMYRLKDGGVDEEQRRRNARFMEPTAEPILTLITCWPYYSNTYRLIVVARLAD